MGFAAGHRSRNGHEKLCGTCQQTSGEIMLFYCPELTSGASVLFDADESGHIARVLRKGAGDEITITDGKGTLAQARIVTANPKKCEAEILTRHVTHPDPFY